MCTSKVQVDCMFDSLRFRNVAILQYRFNAIPMLPVNSLFPGLPKRRIDDEYRVLRRYAAGHKASLFWRLPIRGGWVYTAVFTSRETVC